MPRIHDKLTLPTLVLGEEGLGQVTLPTPGYMDIQDIYGHIEIYMYKYA